MKIHPSASVYGLVRNSTQDRTVIHHLNTMLRISHEIENAVLIDNIRARIFSGFQRISAFLPQVERYQKLAQKAENVYVFAYMDTTPPPLLNVRYIPLEKDHQLIKEWFLVADAPNYFTALVTEEVTSASDMRGRNFRGIWSFDEEMVTILQSWLSDLVGVQPLDFSATRRNYQNQANIVGNIATRLATSLAKRKTAAAAR